MAQDGIGREDWAAAAREKEIGGSGGSLEPPGPLLSHLHTVYLAYSKCLPTRLNSLAERAHFSQAAAAARHQGDTKARIPQEASTALRPHERRPATNRCEPIGIGVPTDIVDGLTPGAAAVTNLYLICRGGITAQLSDPLTVRESHGPLGRGDDCAPCIIGHRGIPNRLVQQHSVTRNSQG
jgi:hypothetical protein